MLGLTGAKQRPFYSLEDSIRFTDRSEVERKRWAIAVKADRV